MTWEWYCIIDGYQYMLVNGQLIINNKNMGTCSTIGGGNIPLKNELKKLYKINVYKTEKIKHKIEIFAENIEEAEKLISEGKYYTMNSEILSLETKLGKIKIAK